MDDPSSFITTSVLNHHHICHVGLHIWENNEMLCWYSFLWNKCIAAMKYNRTAINPVFVKRVMFTVSEGCGFNTGFYKWRCTTVSGSVLVNKPINHHSNSCPGRLQKSSVMQLILSSISHCGMTLTKKTLPVVCVDAKKTTHLREKSCAWGLNNWGKCSKLKACLCDLTWFFILLLLLGSKSTVQQTHLSIKNHKSWSWQHFLLYSLLQQININKLYIEECAENLMKFLGCDSTAKSYQSYRLYVSHREDMIPMILKTQK